MFWCHNRSLLNVYDVETVIITHQQPKSSVHALYLPFFLFISLSFSISVVRSDSWHKPYNLTMENMRRVVSWIRYTNSGSILFYFIQLDELSVWRELKSTYFSNCFLFCCCCFTSYFGEKKKRFESCVRTKYLIDTHTALSQQHMNIETEQPFFLITYVMYTLENKFNAPAPFNNSLNHYKTFYIF